VFDTESVRQGNRSTISGAVRLGLVGQLPCRSLSNKYLMYRRSKRLPSPKMDMKRVLYRHFSCMCKT